MELIGRRFGHIRVTEVVGQGGMGDVYGGYDDTLERKVALKVLNADQRLDDEARERLLREARALSKLEHPNICRIHDYIESGDVDLLVLEYIDGRTLYDAQIEGKSTAEKLRIAIAIAEVLITAHRAAIVHRDLKPENVMLTKTGEVKVLDFGLARWLNRARVKSSGRHGVRMQVAPAVAEERFVSETMVLETTGEPLPIASRRDFKNTAVGITLGTPLYMSPEQARGETLTPASDMFSFGLLLQWMFTGNEPHPFGVTAREAILRVARGETLPVEGAKGDITSLINRFKQFAPADRPTAVEAVERLRFLANKPQRLARRGIAAGVALVLLIGAWRYTVDLRRERAIALSKTEEAQRRRAEVEDMLEFMLGDLRKKLEPVGRLDILDDVAKRALAYSESVRPDQLSLDELVRSAKALHQLTQVRIAQGQLDGALASANRASKFTDAALVRDPKSLPVQFAAATSHFWIANVHRLRGELPQALAHAEIYRNVTGKIAAAAPSNDEYRMERDYGQAAVATILELQGDLRRAAEIYETSVATRRARVSADPSNAKERAQLAVALNKLGFVRQRLGDLQDARGHFQEEFAIYSALTVADPTQHVWRDRLRNSHSYLGGVLDAMGDEESALDHRNAEVSLGRELHEHDPANADWQRDLAIAQMRLGDLLRRLGDLRQGRKAIDESESLLAPLVLRKEARRSWRMDLAVVQTARAKESLAERRIGEAVDFARQADTALSSVDLPEAVTTRHQADAALTLGDALAAKGDELAARREWRRASRILEKLEDGSNDPLLLDLWCRALLQTGRFSEAAGVLSRLDRFGYRNVDLETLRKPRSSEQRRTER